MQVAAASRPIGGVLSPTEAGGWPSIYAAYLGTLDGPPVPRLALLRVGFTEPSESPRTLVRSYRTVSPLPGLLAQAIGGLLSVALSCGSPRLAVSEHPALWSPDLPRRHDTFAPSAATTRPTRRRGHSRTCSAKGQPPRRDEDAPPPSYPGRG